MMSSPNINLDAVYRQSADVITREIAGEVLLVPIRGDLADLHCVYALDPVPAFIWGQLDGQHPLSAIRDAVVATFAVSADQAAADLAEFAAELHAEGLLVGGTPTGGL